MSPDLPSSNSITALLRELREGTLRLFQQEVALARAELKENISRASSDIARLAVGGFVAFAGGVVLLIGLGQLLGVVLERSGVDEELAQWAAPTGLGLLVVIVGWALFSRSKRALSAERLQPRETAESLKTTKEWVQNKLPQS